MVSSIAIVGSVIVSALGAVFGLYQARKADRSATTTKTIEIGVKDLVDQYRETNEELRTQATQTNEHLVELQKEVNTLKAKVAELEAKKEDLLTVIDNKDSEIIRLKHKTGEPL